MELNVIQYHVRRRRMKQVCPHAFVPGYSALKFDTSPWDDGRYCESWAHLVEWMRDRRLFMPVPCMRLLMYTVWCAAWLAIFLGERGARLDYKMVWRSPNPVKLLLAVWRISLSFRITRAARVQRKVFRWLATSAIFDIKIRKILVPTYSDQVVALVRRNVRHVLRQIARDQFPDLARFYESRIRVIKSRPRYYVDSWTII